MCRGKKSRISSIGVEKNCVFRQSIIEKIAYFVNWLVEKNLKFLRTVTAENCNISQSPKKTKSIA